MGLFLQQVFGVGLASSQLSSKALLRRMPAKPVRAWDGTSVWIVISAGHAAPNSSGADHSEGCIPPLCAWRLVPKVQSQQRPTSCAPRRPNSVTLSAPDQFGSRSLCCPC